MKLIKSTITAAILAGLAGCGGGSSSDSNDTDGNGGGNTTGGEIIISGTVTKGTMKQASVVAFKLENSQWSVIPDSEIKTETGMITDDNGFYSFSVPEYSGPVKVELQANENTKMVCDAVDGCGAVPFGSDIDLNSTAPDFTLSSISNITASDEQITLNVSALTHISSELITANLDLLDATTIQQQNSKIANAFGVSGNITTLTSTKIIGSDGASVDSASVIDAAKNKQAELKYALVNAGIANALFKATSDSKDITTLLAEATQDIVNAGGTIAVKPNDTNSTFELTTNDVLEAAAKTSSDKLKPAISSDTEASDNLSVIETEVISDKTQKEQEAGEDGRIDPDSDGEPVGATPVEKAKAMVNDVRLLTQLLGVQATSNETAGFIPQVEAYETLLLDANDMVAQEAQSFELLQKIETVLSMINVADGDAIEDGDITAKTYNVADFDASLSGSISFNAETMLFSVTNVMPVATTSGATSARADAAEFISKANLTAKINGFESDDSGQEFSIALNGVISSENALIKLGSETESSIFSVKTKKVITLDDLDSAVDLDYQIEEIRADLYVNIEQAETTEITNPIAFSGKLKATIVPQLEWRINQAWDDETYFYVSKEEVALPEMLTLSGDFSSSQGESISASLTVNITNARDFESSSFEGIGEEVANIGSVTVGEDQKTIEFSLPTATDVVSLSGSFDGDSSNWVTHFTITHADNSVTNEYESFSEIQLDEINTRYVYTYVVAEAGEDSVWAEQLVIEPTQDYFEVYFIENIEVNVNDYLGDGGILKQADGSTLMLNGDFRWEGTTASLDDFIEYSYLSEDLFSFGDPREINNISELVSRAQSNHPEYFFFNLADIGKVQLQPLDYTPGLSNSLNGYNISGVVNDAVSITLNSDNTQLDVDIASGDFSYSEQFESTSNNNFTYTFTQTGQSAYDRYQDKYELSTSPVNSINNADMLSFIKSSSWSDGTNWTIHYAYKGTATPIDDNSDGSVDSYQIQGYDCWLNPAETHLDNCSWSPNNDYSVSADDFEIWWYPENITDVVDASRFYSKASYYSYIDNIGGVYVGNIDFDSLKATKSLTLDAYVDPYSISEDTAFETESNYLNLAATINVSLTVDDYDVQLNLSGTRNGLESGIFNLGFTYELADNNGIRNLDLMINSADEDEDGDIGKATLTNNSGVKIELNSATSFEQASAESEDSDVTIGVITVDGEDVGEIYYRPANGMYSVEYSDDTMETLN
ncbi:hypothetical protein N7931_02575 [Catenovulum sp. 2E275]|uniref:hypothetical protein n=1 Tax=Catenovulum sp. 2E275 TaxID=2980497 RepID=UPI0021D22018|nr:hypothetical protein [Catenovulum sp. 2E275]MCU4674506.1 hypothetical protein [Catenovulum sp. 2E275]